MSIITYGEEYQHNFDMYKETFLIDSNNLDSVNSKLYGWCIAGGSIINSIDDLNELTPDPNGCYVYIKRENDKIQIMQDYIGCYVIYLFESKQKDYFCISNSFDRIVNHLRIHHKLSFDMDIATVFFTCGHPSLSVKDTMIKEIKMIERNAVININISSKKLQLEYVDYNENSVYPDSEEGIKIIDRWYSKYCNIIKSLSQQDIEIKADLTGGIDSRMGILPVLGSGINMDRIWVRSALDNKKGHDEDYKIATQIAQDYDFLLNGRYYNYKSYNCFSSDDLLNMFYVFKGGFHRELYKISEYSENPKIIINGYGGESIRKYWGMNMSEMIDSEINISKRSYFKSISNKEVAIRNVLTKSFKDILNLDKSCDEAEITIRLYKESRNRHHVGKSMIQYYLTNQYVLPILMDSELAKLKTYASNDPDKEDILHIFLLERFNNQLLNYPIQGGRTFSLSGIHKAKLINSKYPYNKVQMNYSITLSKIQPRQYSRVETGAKTIEEKILKAFRSEENHRFFTSVYSEKLWNKIAFSENSNYFNTQRMISSFYVAKIIKDCSISEYLSETPVDIINNCKEESLNLMNYSILTMYIIGRIDIKNYGGIDNDIDILSISDKDASVKSPEWFCKKNRGKGYVIQSEVGTIDLNVKCVNGGAFEVSLRSKDIRKQDGSRAELKIDFNNLIINNNIIFEKVKTVSHDEPFKYSMDVNDGDIISIHAEWTPHDIRL